MSASLIVVRAGLHTTVQDEGRPGFQHLGVPVGGALDAGALWRANRLVGNAPGEAALEVTLTGCVLRATADVHVAVAGARFAVVVDDVPVSMDRTLTVPAGATLRLGARLAGARAIIAVRGGIDTTPILGSRSAWPLDERRGALREGDVLPVGTRVAGPPLLGEVVPGPAYRSVLRVLPAPEASGDAAVMTTLCGGAYRIAASASRMAYPLEDGPPVPLRAPARSSSGTVTGALQILPTGMPVLLMHERQTTGGYPVAAVVIGADLPHAAQLAPGDRVRFEPCDMAAARHALLRAGQGSQR